MSLGGKSVPVVDTEIRPRRGAMARWTSGFRPEGYLIVRRVSPGATWPPARGAGSIRS
jgi:hypothetical protein